MNLYYHNPRCSKSRQGIEILREANVEFSVQEYLKDPPKPDDILTVCHKLAKSPAEIVRTKEVLYNELELGNKNFSPEEWAQILSENPILIERPIFITSERAVIGRPPELIKELL